MAHPEVVVQPPFLQRELLTPPLTTNHSPRFALLCSLHGAAVAVPTSLFLFDAPPWWTLGVGGFLMTLVYMFLGYAESNRQEFWLSPVSFFFWWYAMGYGLSAIYAATQAYDPGHLYLVNQIVTGEDLAAGYVISLVGAFSLHLGYSLTRPDRSLASALSGAPAERSDFRLWALTFLLGIAALLKPEFFGAIGAARTILQFAPYGVLLVFCSLPREYFGLNKFLYTSFFLTGNFLLVTSAFLYGSKAMAMFSLLPVFSAILVRPSLKRSLPLFVIGAALVYFFIVAPIIMTARNGAPEDESRLQRIEFAAGQTANFFSEDLRFAFQEQVERFLYRQFESTAVGFIVSDVRSRGFRYGETMQNLTYAFIPRLLWPDKPVVTRGNWFTAYLGGSASEEEAKTSTGMYVAGELYWNFGIPGVMIGMGALGALFAIIYRMLGKGPHHHVIPIVIFINLIMRIVDQAAAVEVATLMIYVLILTCIYRYFTPPTDAVQGMGRKLRA